MTNDRELLALHLTAVLVFTAITVYFRPLVLSFSRKRRMRPPHTGLIVMVQVWFALLAAASLYLLLKGPHGLASSH